VLPHCEHIPGCWSVGSYALGLERSTVRLHGEAYLTRFILYIAGRTVRLHKFHRGDDERAPHDHPWDFWTFPLCGGYAELIPDFEFDSGFRLNWVPGWRWSFRPAKYQHIVVDPEKPFWTLVVTRVKSNGWGFWPSYWKPLDKERMRVFVPWREWK
jgi:hypothetical protein